jgi:hypothetical protein
MAWVGLFFTGFATAKKARNMKKRILRLAHALPLVLLQACGGGDSISVDGAASDGITESDAALYARAVNVYARQCSLYGYYQDCTAYDSAVYYFNSKCYQGNQQACGLSQDIQASFTLARLSRGY